MRGAWGRAALLAAVGAACLATALPAQAAQAGRDSAIARLKIGQQIRISAEGMQRLIGRAGAATGDTLDFAQDDAVRRIPIPAIDTLWVRGGAGVTGAIVGGGVGAALGLLALAATHSICDNDCGYSGLEVVGGMVFGAALGAPLGAIIGGRVQKWHRRYP